MVTVPSNSIRAGYRKDHCCPNLPGANLSAVQCVVSFIEDLLLPVGQGAETGIVDLVENPIDLGPNVFRSTNVHFIAVWCWRGGIAAEPLWHLDIRAGGRKLSGAVVEITEVDPAGEHASEMGGVSNVIVSRQLLEQETEHCDSQEDERQVFWFYGDRNDEEEEKSDWLIGIKTRKYGQ